MASTAVNEIGSNLPIGSHRARESRCFGCPTKIRTVPIMIQMIPDMCFVTNLKQQAHCFPPTATIIIAVAVICHPLQYAVKHAISWNKLPVEPPRLKLSNKLPVESPRLTEHCCVFAHAFTSRVTRIDDKFDLYGQSY